MPAEWKETPTVATEARLVLEKDAQATWGREETACTVQSPQRTVHFHMLLCLEPGGNLVTWRWLLVPFYKQRDWCSESWYSLPKAAQPATDRVEASRIQPNLRALGEECCRTGSGVEPVLPCCVVMGCHFTILGLNFSIWHLRDYFFKTPLFYLKQKKSPIFLFLSSNLWALWELGRKEGRMPKNWCL